MWEYEQMIFDHFAHIATRPLQYVFADYAYSKCLLSMKQHAVSQAASG